MSNSTSALVTSAINVSSTLAPDATSLKGISSGDIAVVVIYFIVILSIGLLDFWWPLARRWLSLSASIKPGHSQESSSDYFLASREMSWPAVMASLFASNIGSEHFIGLAGSGAATGRRV